MCGLSDRQHATNVLSYFCLCRPQYAPGIQERRQQRHCSTRSAARPAPAGDTRLAAQIFAVVKPPQSTHTLCTSNRSLSCDLRMSPRFNASDHLCFNALMPPSRRPAGARRGSDDDARPPCRLPAVADAHAAAAMRHLGGAAARRDAGDPPGAPRSKFQGAAAAPGALHPHVAADGRHAAHGTPTGRCARRKAAAAAAAAALRPWG